ncbi:magnesium transporter CorA [Candidatus Woesearchaeota archaeon]|nr:magnesium transporter CorA [Candidatus Woesearchaeota archaeon]
MTRKNGVKGLAISHNSASVNESHGKTAPGDGESTTFLVGTGKDGIAFYMEGNNVDDFLPKLKKCRYSWVNIQVEDVARDGPKISQSLGFSPNLVTNLLKKKVSGYEDIISELALLVPAIRIIELDVHISPLVILIKKDMILSIHGPEVTRLVKFSRYAVTYFKKIPGNLKVIDKLSLILFRILDENDSRNFDNIRLIQEQGETISKFLIKPTGPRERIGMDMYKLKRALIQYLDTLWASLDVAQYLRYGDAEMISDDANVLQKFGILGRDLTRQISISEQMSTVLASGLEVLQSIYNNQLQILNNRMALVVAWLTILGTAVLVPNTLATIFGISYISEHLNLHIVVWTLVISTLVAVMASYWFVRKHNLLTTKVD